MAPSGGPIAQRLEQGTHNPLVAGSNPAGPKRLTEIAPTTDTYISLCLLLEHGFFGAEADETRQKLRQKYSQLLTLLKDLNDISHEYLRGLKYNPGDRRQWFAVAWLIRGLMTFQSVLALLERGCIEDACALSRTLLQAYIRLAAIAADPRVLNRILAAALSE